MKRGRSTGTPTKAQAKRFECYDGLVPIPGLACAYATADGEIFSNRSGRLHRMTGGDNGKGYLRVRPWHRSLSIHRLVAITFLGPIPEGMEVNHKDGNKQNNRPGNLEYLVHQENVRHAIETGLWWKPKVGESHPNAKLSTEDATAIVREYWALAIDGRLPNGAAQALAEKYSVTRDYPRLLATGKAWKCLQVAA